MTFTAQDFYSISGYCNSDISNESVEFFLEAFFDIVNRSLGYKFTTATVTESDKINYPIENYLIGQNFVSITPWQEAGLTVKIGDITESNEPTLASPPLVLGKDYDLFRFATGFQKLPPTVIKDNPVVAIKLLNTSLWSSSMLRVYGTWGFSNTIPSDIKMFIYTSLKIALEINTSSTNSLQSGGSGISSGAISLVQEYTTKIEFNKASSELLGSLLTYFTDVMSTDSAQALLLPYKIQFTGQIFQF